MIESDLDVIGYWTENKLQILKNYSHEYAKILNKQKAIRYFDYIDGFSGAGKHISRSTGKEIEGSPMVALKIQPKFSHFHFIDMDGKRAESLRKLSQGREDVTVYEGDCNNILLDKVFPKCRFEDYCRALCLLDPYDLNPKWEVVKKAGQMRSIELFINFMIMDAKMNVIWKNPERVPKSQIERMNNFWGDESWRDVSYKEQKGLFGMFHEKVPDHEIAQAYKKRLKDVAGFKYVPDPVPMKNNNNVVIYYLFFASQNKTGEKIAKAIFNNYKRGAFYGH